MKKILILFSFFIIFLLCLFLNSGPVSAADILNIRHWTAPDHTRIVVDTSDEARFEVRKEQGKITVDFSEAVLLPEVAAEYVLDKPAVTRVCITALSGDRVRIEIFTAASVEPDVFTLGRILDKPHRVVIDVNIPETAQKETVEPSDKKTIVVIDPGHGGEDPGAIGRHGTKEKDIVLRISKVLRDMLVQRGYKVLLTREGDYYVSFKKRLQIARDCNADLFLSIHADACMKRSVKGASVYCLSTKRASSEAAQILAASQNLSDIIGGVPNSQNNDETDPVILNMLQTETLNQAKSFGMMTLSKIRRINQLKFETVQEAPFRVLKLPEVTSILIETAYLSNTREELLLKSNAYQKDIAWAITAAVTEYLPLSSLAEFLEIDRAYEPLSKRAFQKRVPLLYRVKKGDRLEEIAQRFDTTIEMVMEQNNLKSKNLIYAGQELAIGKTVISEPSKSVHLVKKGETLSSIARKYDIAVEALIKMNDITSEDRIYVGQLLNLMEKSVDTNGNGENRISNVVYVVKRGDRLADIAKEFDATVNDLIKVNNLESKNKIYVGQELVIRKTEIAELRDHYVPSSSQNKEVKVSERRAVKDKTYVVKRGDRLDEIAKRYGASTDYLMKINKLKSRDLIYIGQKLSIADGSSDGDFSSQGKKEIYIVRKGDTVEDIAKRFGTTAEELVSSNSLKSRNLIFTGQQLKIP
ncbi:MAG: LysM peptidoglycan-binding domain-containing protein [Syntrophales bacterium]|nr:LysM peptidoglycan-binding domain-containing protein [Syntrophales bacterium]MDY0044369.1 LysM peptidoglycan-binding domain-containing protein [Syntrophales bacterium]